jgi:hypothetical protein
LHLECFPGWYEDTNSAHQQDLSYHGWEQVKGDYQICLLKVEPGNEMKKDPYKKKLQCTGA